MNSFLSITNLNFAYTKNSFIFKELTLEFLDNIHTISIVGPDGIGKSTLLKLLFALLKPNSGSIKFFNQELKQIRPQLSYMPQDSCLYEDLSVIDNLSLANSLFNQDNKSQTQLYEMLSYLELKNFANYRVNQLSGGMRQKLALLCTIVKDPKILILDEPTVGVDPISRNALWDIVNEYLSHNNYCIYTTAYLEEAQEADVCLVLSNNKCLQFTKTDIEQIQNLCYYVKSSHYLDIYHQLLKCNFEKYLCDLSLSLGMLQIVLKKQVTAADFSKFLQEICSYEFILLKREAKLDDLYLLTLKQKDFLIYEKYQNIQNADQVLNNKSQTEDIISLNEVKKVFNNFVAVDSSTFTVKKGEIFGLLGPNGAGKTTTFRMMCALLDKSYGQILIMHQDLAKAKAKLRSQIGYVSQKFSLYNDLSCYQNIVYFAKSYGLSDKQLAKRLDTLLNIFDLKDYMQVVAKELPFGVQRELSMTVALLHEPKILFLDEATSGADIIARRKFFLILNLLKQNGVTIIVTTHFLEEAEFCDRFLIQAKGKIICLGRPDDICLNDKKQRISVHELFLNSCS